MYESFILRLNYTAPSVTSLTVCSCSLQRQTVLGGQLPEQMRLPTLMQSLGLIACALVLMLPLFGSCHPAPTSEQQPKLVFMDQFSRPGLGFNWRNITCPLCKVLFTILDIALLVMFGQLLFFFFF